MIDLPQDYCYNGVVSRRIPGGAKQQDTPNIKNPAETRPIRLMLLVHSNQCGE